MMDFKPNTPVLHYSNTPWLMALMFFGLVAGCDSLPGKPMLEERWQATAEVTDFSQLYASNCSGCHGADGRLGLA